MAQVCCMLMCFPSEDQRIQDHLYLEEDRGHAAEPGAASYRSGTAPHVTTDQEDTRGLAARSPRRARCPADCCWAPPEGADGGPPPSARGAGRAMTRTGGRGRPHAHAARGAPRPGRLGGGGAAAVRTSPAPVVAARGPRWRRRSASMVAARCPRWRRRVPSVRATVQYAASANWLLAGARWAGRWAGDGHQKNT